MGPSPTPRLKHFHGRSQVRASSQDQRAHALRFLVGREREDEVSELLAHVEASESLSLSVTTLES